MSGTGCAAPPEGGVKFLTYMCDDRAEQELCCASCGDVLLLDVPQLFEPLQAGLFIAHQPLVLRQ